MKDPIDPGVFEELCTLDDAQGIHDLIELFLSNSQRLLAELYAKAARGESLDVVRLAHQLKSTTASVGALDLSKLLSGVEGAARAGDLDRVRTQSAAIEKEYHRVQTRLRERIGAAN